MGYATKVSGLIYGFQKKQISADVDLEEIMNRLIVLLIIFLGPLSNAQEENEPSSRPRHRHRQNEIRRSVERISILLNDKEILDAEAPTRLPSQALWNLISDKTEIKGGGMVMAGGHIIASRHRFLFALDSNIQKLEIRLQENKAKSIRNDPSDFNVSVMASLKSGKANEVFRATYSSSSCINFHFDLLRWIESANTFARSNKSPNAEWRQVPKAAR
jgi:hypothetical protein